MRYMFLIYTNEASETPELHQGAVVQHDAVMADARARGVLLAADPLRSADTATTVRRALEKPFVTDGPFADTKEQLAGYYILECKNLDEAIEWARRIPSACGDDGAVEIRPIKDMKGRS